MKAPFLTVASNCRIVRAVKYVPISRSYVKRRSPNKNWEMTWHSRDEIPKPLASMSGAVPPHNRFGNMALASIARFDFGVCVRAP